MLFTGTSEVTIDAKGRLAIPARYRNALLSASEGTESEDEGRGFFWYCVAWPGGMLRLYTEDAFERMGRRLGDSLTASSQRAQLDRTLFGNAERLEMDSAGRIMVPKRHLKLTGIPNEVVVVGARNRLEVWSREAWEAQEQDQFSKLSALIDALDEVDGGS
ncbi:MAG: division/cell wall cluster transcriptional repressor MraZ [Phycisphaeraceae bacterium]|nr:division/cell wall cluster transcriptional repressor MraZ [Phycisphaeraceae bacterium]MCW5753707.1 division/cell wall cluster transcriptional repressor MraZ [Phycisphaeraceae bacterium]